jgi:glycine/D-amino acid oxidase-like deaminating enzyme
MSIAAPEPKANTGQPISRYDAAAKVTGKAQYAADVALSNPVYAYLVTSSIAKGRIDGFDLDAAKRVGGVIDIVTQENAEKLKEAKLFSNGGYAGTTIQPLKSPDIAHEGQIVAIVLADTFEAAREASHAVRVNYTAAVPTTTFDSPGTTTARAKGQLAQFKEDPSYRPARPKIAGAARAARDLGLFHYHGLCRRFCYDGPPLSNLSRFVISVLDSEDTEQADLRGGRSPWHATTKHAARLDVSENIKCDTLIVGGGITGSLIAERLTRQGLDVVIIDRELPGRGSTAASTSMLLWEIDRSLTQLTEIYGFERASRAYHASLRAVAGLKLLIRQLGISCELRDKQSLYLAAGNSSKGLLREHQLRERAGLPGDFLDHGLLLDVFGIARAGAIVSTGAADADPTQLARGMLRVAIDRGARVFEAEAVNFDSAARSIGVQLNNDRQIKARSVVLATGYTLPAIIRSTIQTVSASWAIATTPQPQNVWKGGALIWEDSKDYLYARTTTAGRIIIGGEDSDEVIEPDARDRLILQK